MPIDIALDGPAARAVPTDRTTRSNFFVGYSTLLLTLLVLGFAPTFFLRAAFDTEPLSPAAWMHGIVLTGWFLAFVGQSLLVRTGHLRLHRRVGRFGAAVAVAGTLGFVWLALSLYFGRAPGVAPELVEHARFVRIVRELTVFAAFPALVTLALWLRRRPAAHKRLMLLATIAILPPGISRLVLWTRDLLPAGDSIPHIPVLFGSLALLLAVPVVRDKVRHGRVHPALRWGAPLWFTWLVGSGIVIPRLMFT